MDWPLRRIAAPVHRWCRWTWRGRLICSACLPSAILHEPRPMTEADYDAIAARWRKAHGGGQGANVAVLGWEERRL